MVWLNLPNWLVVNHALSGFCVMGPSSVASLVSAPSVLLWSLSVDGSFSMHATDSFRNFPGFPVSSEKGIFGQSKNLVLPY